MTTTRRIPSVLAAAIFAALALTGCGPSTDDVRRDVTAAVREADSNIVDTDISVGQGLTGPGVRLTIYLSDTSEDATIAALEAEMEAAWTHAPTKPTGIYLDAAASPRPTTERLRPTPLRLRPLEDRLDVPGSIANDTIGAGSDELTEFYGPWGAGD